MTSRERIIATINHQEPDYVPLDLGASGQTGMSASTLYKLRRAYGLEEHPIRICEPGQLLGEIEEDLLKKVGADVIPLWNKGNMMGLSNNYTKLWHMTDNTPVWMPDNFEYDIDEKGDTYVYPCGDRTAPCSLHMTSDGFFFDSIDRAPEYDEDNLTPVEDFRENYTVKTEEDCKYWEEQSKRLFENTEYGIIGALGGMGLGDSAEIPGPFVRYPKGIRRFDDWIMAHILYPDYIEEVFEYQTEVMLKNLELYRQAVGDCIQIVWISGTDFGSQNGLIYSKEVFQKIYKPYYKKVNDWVHNNTNWKTFYHCCGAISELIPDFIEMGVDILNPVQCSANGMNAKKLKETYGEQIVFWGGGVDTQKTLPMGTPKEVRQEVLDRLEIFSKGGGYVFTSIHNVVAKVPVENLLAMYDAVREFRGL